MSKRVTVTGKNFDGQDVTVFVKKPNAKQLADAKVYEGRTFTHVVQNKSALFRGKLLEYMKEQGLWSEAKDKELTAISERLAKNVKKLKAGGMKVTEGKELALKIADDRLSHARLLSQYRDLDAFTVEGICENANFDYLCSVCILNDEGNPVFKDVDEYKENADEEYVEKAAAALADMQTGFNSNWQKDLPENKFLIKYKFVDDDLRFINQDGKFTDRQGRLIDDEGRYLDDEGNFVDADGNPVDEDGNSLVEEAPFLDEAGQPVVT